MAHATRADYPAAPLAQQAFFFVTKKERKAQDQRYQDQASTPKRVRRPSPRPSDENQIQLELLEAPLFATADGEVLDKDPLVAADADPYLDVDSNTAEELKQKAIDVEWMADRADQFLEWLLQRNLRFLTTRGNAVEKKSVIEWIFAPEIDGTVIDYRSNGRGTGRELPLVTANLPFSFEWICRAIELDCDHLRHGLIKALKNAQASTVGKKSANIRDAVQLAQTLEKR